MKHMSLQHAKGKITIVGEVYAHEGSEFIYIGMSEVCTPCPVCKVCHNLVSGRRYKVISVRDPVHECSVHEGKARTVEVVPALIPARILLPSNASSARNTSFVYYPPCNERCEYVFQCHAPGLVKGQRYIIREIETEEMQLCQSGDVCDGDTSANTQRLSSLHTVPCPVGESRTLVLLELLPDELPRFVSKQE
ncbi:MAG: UPF0179 family protein [Methanomicrobiales archaeon]|jgi:uncharacterized protein (UPF0179 family)|nr:UPF0179 family protein [Methanomicrobiales archaeon]